MIDVYQNACLVLQTLKTKGTQRVVVQYQQMNVNEGGPPAPWTPSDAPHGLIARSSCACG